MMILDDITDLIYEIEQRPMNQQIPKSGKFKGFVKGVGNTAKQTAKRVGKMALVGTALAGGAAMMNPAFGTALLSAAGSIGSGISGAASSLTGAGGLTGATKALAAAKTAASSTIGSAARIASQAKGAGLITKIAHSALPRFIDPSVDPRDGKKLVGVAKTMAGSWKARLGTIGAVAGTKEFLKSKTGAATRERFMKNTKVGQKIGKEVASFKKDFNIKSPAQQKQILDMQKKANINNKPNPM